MNCEACGTGNVVRSRSSRVDKIVRFLTGRKRFTCDRCGWTGRRAWLAQSRTPWTAPVETSPPAPVPPQEFDIDRFD